MTVQNCDPTQESKFAERDRIVLKHLALVNSIARRVHENLPLHVEFDDLVQAGVLGLFDAANRFNPEKQVSFPAYAQHRVKGAILDSLRQMDWATRDLRRQQKQVEAITRDLTASLQRIPTESEVAGKLGVDADRWRQIMLDLRSIGLISASTRATDHEELRVPDLPSKPETQPDHMCAKQQMRMVLTTAIDTLPERYKKVITFYYTKDMTMKEIGGVLGIKESRVSQIHQLAVAKMQVALQENGISSANSF